ncbi:MAG: hypothetical protein ABQ298_01650 [Puniceicoccaceae bacterium]
MKTTPINFTTFLEPHLIRFWKGHASCDGKHIEVQRTHNLNLSQTTLNAIAREPAGTATLLGSIQLVQIPQQEKNPAINALIHLPHLDQPTPLLMVFKSAGDNEKWAERLVKRLENLMASAPKPAEPEPTSTSESAPSNSSADADTDASETTDEPASESSEASTPEPPEKPKPKRPTAPPASE